MTNKGFEFQVSVQTESGFWTKKIVKGRGDVIETGFNMQLGTDGYTLRVTESDHYAPGTVISCFRYSIRA